MYEITNTIMAIHIPTSSELLDTMLVSIGIRADLYYYPYGYNIFGKKADKRPFLNSHYPFG
jgi:hypothetical protein